MGLNTRPSTTRNKGKGGALARLPNRHALNELTQGDLVQRSINNYAKKTPSGAGALDAPNFFAQNKGGF